MHARVYECVLSANLLDPLDPDAVIGDVQIIQYVGRVVLSEDFVNIQQAFEDTGFPWAQEHTVTGEWKNSVIPCSLLRMTMQPQTLADTACF